MNWTETELAYAAGLIDGEGSICIMCQKAPPHDRSPRYMLLVTVGMSTREAPQWLHATFGGGLYPNDSNARRFGFRTVWQWRLHGVGAAEVLTGIAPYSVTKREQVRLGLEFGDGLTESRQRLEPEELVRRHDLMLQMRILNARYRPWESQKEAEARVRDRAS